MNKKIKYIIINKNKKRIYNICLLFYLKDI